MKNTFVGNRVILEIREINNIYNFIKLYQKCIVIPAAHNLSKFM